MKLLLLLVGLSCIAALTPFAWAADAGTGSPIDSALVVLTGNNSQVWEPAYQRIESAAEWNKTWLKHLGLKKDTVYRTAMEVDFNRFLVVALFGGESFNSCGYRVEAVREDKASVFVSFSSIGYQTAGPEGGADRVAPYAFVVLPRSEKQIVLHETARSKNPRDAPLTKEVARLEFTD